MKKIKYFSPIGGTYGLSYEVGQTLQIGFKVYKIIGKTDKSLKLIFIRNATAGVD